MNYNEQLLYVILSNQQVIMTHLLRMNENIPFSWRIINAKELAARIDETMATRVHMKG